MNFTKNNIYNTVKDFSVSGESFSLLLNEEYQILKTDPQPSLEKLPSYYESEDYISHTDGKRTLFEKMYHLVKKNAIQKKVYLLSKYNTKGSVLDIGAGTGDFLIAAKKSDWNTTGIEPSEKAKKIAIEKGVSFENSLADLKNETFDAITMWHV